jgi:hypothetical protein
MKKNLLSVTLPGEWLQRIEADRGDVTRSRYVLRLIEAGYSVIDKAAGAASITK